MEILRTAREFFGDNARVTLFGSRVDDSRRGGDIDLMIETNMVSTEALARRIQFLVRLKQRIGDRAIDLVLRTPGDTERPIHRVAEEQGVVIR